MDIRITTIDGDSVALVSEGLYPQRGNEPVPERRLAEAILAQALIDLTWMEPSRPTTNKLALLKRKWCRSWKQDAAEWFFSEDQFPGSFRWVCRKTGLSCDKVRKWIQEYYGAEEPAKRKLRRTVFGLTVRPA